MNDTKRLIRRISLLPATLLTPWEQGFIHGAMFGSSFTAESTLNRLEDRLIKYERKMGKRLGDDLQEAA